MTDAEEQLRAAEAQALKEAEEKAAAWQEALTKAKFDMETARDNTLVIIAGGALTVSFAFIGSFIEHGTLVRLSWLVAAWIAWVLALLITLIGYHFAIADYRQVITALSEARWGDAQMSPRFHSWIEPINIGASASAIAGFTCFGYFAIGVLQGVANGHEKGSNAQDIASHGAGADAHTAQSGPTSAPRTP